MHHIIVMNTHQFCG